MVRGLSLGFLPWPDLTGDEYAASSTLTSRGFFQRLGSLGLFGVAREGWLSSQWFFLRSKANGSLGLGFHEQGGLLKLLG